MPRVSPSLSATRSQSAEIHWFRSDYTGRYPSRQEPRVDKFVFSGDFKAASGRTFQAE